MNTKLLQLKYEYRIKLLAMRNEIGNIGIINKLKRKLRNLEAR